MRWIAIPLLALLLGCGLWSAPASAKVENGSRVSNAAKASKATPSARSKAVKKRAKAAKTVKAAPPPPVQTIAQRDAASERIYDGVLPTEEEKIIMPAVKDERGRAECVQLLKALMDAPRTLFWKEGRKLKASWDHIRPGTAIATFKKGRYPQKGKASGSKHAAIFVRASEAGIYVLDQFAGQMDVEERFIPWHHPRDKRPSNNAAAYSTVRW